MIHKFQVPLASLDGPVPYNIGYQLYGALMQRLPPELGELLHKNEIAPLTQHFCRGPGGYVWRLCAFEEELAEAIREVLAREEVIRVESVSRRFSVGKAWEERVSSLQELMTLSQAHFADAERISVRLVTPAAFKQNGRYVLYPTAPMMLGNLVTKWNALNRDSVIDDEFALRQIEEGVTIRQYRLQSARYSLKGAKIFGFTGELTLQLRLPAPLAEVAKLLLYFANYAGIGIKSTLGMGGAETSPVRKREGEGNM